MKRDEPPKKVSKLAIEAEMESDKYDTHTTVTCYGCGGKEIERTTENVYFRLIPTSMTVLTYVGLVVARGHRWGYVCDDFRHTDGSPSMGTGDYALRAYTLFGAGSC